MYWFLCLCGIAGGYCYYNYPEETAHAVQNADRVARWATGRVYRECRRRSASGDTTSGEAPVRKMKRPVVVRRTTFGGGEHKNAVTI
jgi:hypothetical protein